MVTPRKRRSAFAAAPRACYHAGRAAGAPFPCRPPVAGRTDMIRIRKILYPTDFSPYSNQAYFHAVALAESHGASLTILYVYPAGFGAPETTTEGEDRTYWQAQLEQIRPVNESIATYHVLLEGDPANEIVEYARDA